MDKKQKAAEELLTGLIEDLINNGINRYCGIPNELKVVIQDIANFGNEYYDIDKDILMKSLIEFLNS